MNDDSGMNGSDGPPWDPTIWAELRAAIRAEAEKGAVVQQFLPIVHGAENETIVNVDYFSPSSGRVAEDYIVPVVELETRFELTDAQVRREGSHREALSAAVSRARTLAYAESLVLLQGEAAVQSRRRADADPSSIFDGPGRIPRRGPQNDWDNTDNLRAFEDLEAVIRRIHERRTFSAEESARVNTEIAVQNAELAIARTPPVNRTEVNRLTVSIFNLTGRAYNLTSTITKLDEFSYLAGQAKLAQGTGSLPAMTTAFNDVTAAISPSVPRVMLEEEDRTLGADLVQSLSRFLFGPAGRQNSLRSRWPDDVYVKHGTRFAGLMQYARELPSLTVAKVNLTNSNDPLGVRYHIEIVKTLNAAISRLDENGHYGPYVLLVHPEIYADARSPLGSDNRLRPIEQFPSDLEHFSGSRALEKDEGLVISLAGDSIDLVRPTDSYDFKLLRINSRGRYQFQLRSRLALRVKRQGTLVALKFEK